MARIRAVLRRSQVAGAARRDGRRTVFSFAHWRLDLSTRKLCSNDGLRVPLILGVIGVIELVSFFKSNHVHVTGTLEASAPSGHVHSAVVVSQ